jgi:hypothetical protein
MERDFAKPRQSIGPDELERNVQVVATVTVRSDRLVRFGVHEWRGKRYFHLATVAFDRNQEGVELNRRSFPIFALPAFRAALNRLAEHVEAEAER